MLDDDMLEKPKDHRLTKEKIVLKKDIKYAEEGAKYQNHPIPFHLQMLFLNTVVDLKQ